jgi:hypothetical protein
MPCCVPSRPQAGRFTWRVAYDVFGRDWHYYFYTLRKGLKGEEEVEESAAPVEQARALCCCVASRVRRLTLPLLLHPQQPPGESMLHTHMDDESYLMRAMLGSDDEDGGAND